MRKLHPLILFILAGLALGIFGLIRAANANSYCSEGALECQAGYMKQCFNDRWYNTGSPCEGGTNPSPTPTCAYGEETCGKDGYLYRCYGDSWGVIGNCYSNDGDYDHH